MNRRQSAGFTLLEILVAFVIAAAAIGVTMRVFSGGLETLRVADEYSRAVFLAQSRLAEVGTEIPVRAGELTGESGRQFQWRVSMRPSEWGGVPRPGGQGLYEVLVEVRWNEGQKSRRVELSSLRVGGT